MGVDNVYYNACCLHPRGGVCHRNMFRKDNGWKYCKVRIALQHKIQMALKTWEGTVS